jgi:phosphoserine phosphatase
MVKTLKNAGIQTALVSGGFTFFTNLVRDALGFDFVRANRLGFSGNVLDGTVKEPLLDAEGKKEFLEELAAGTPEAVIAIGDGANDIPMFKAAGMSLAYHGKPVAEKAAAGRLRHIDLTGVLFTLGIGEATFQK